MQAARYEWIVMVFTEFHEIAWLRDATELLRVSILMAPARTASSYLLDFFITLDLQFRP